MHQPSSSCLSFCVTSVTLGASKFMEEMGDYCMVSHRIFKSCKFFHLLSNYYSQSSRARTLHPVLPQLQERSNYRIQVATSTYIPHLPQGFQQPETRGREWGQASLGATTILRAVGEQQILGHSPVKRPCDCGLSDKSKRSGPGVWVQAGLFSMH